MQCRHPYHWRDQPKRNGRAAPKAAPKPHPRPTPSPMPRPHHKPHRRPHPQPRPHKKPHARPQPHPHRRADPSPRQHQHRKPHALGLISACRRTMIPPQWPLCYRQAPPSPTTRSPSEVSRQPTRCRQPGMSHAMTAASQCSAVLSMTSNLCGPGICRIPEPATSGQFLAIVLHVAERVKAIAPLSVESIDVN